MHEPAIVDAVLRLAAKPAKDCVLCWARRRATWPRTASRGGFRSGVAVEALDVARMPPTPGAVEALLALTSCWSAAETPVCGGPLGGGLDEELRKAAQRDAVDRQVCGAICWLAGHSDGADPESYAVPMLAGGSAAAKHAGRVRRVRRREPWEYIRSGGSESCPDCAARTTTGPSRTATPCY